MSYIYTIFIDADLPTDEHAQDHGVMPVESTLIDAIGTSFDWRGDDRQTGRDHTFGLTGKYVGELTYFDDGGDLSVDEGGNYLIVGNARDMLRSAIVAIRSQIGKRGSIWRKGSDNTLQWLTARLQAAPWPRSYQDHHVMATMSCKFETQMQFWHAETPKTITGVLTAGVGLALPVSIGGETVNDAVLTITRTSGTITAITIVNSDLGISISWTGSLGASDALVIDCSNHTVRIVNGLNIFNAYSTFSLTGSHTVTEWLPLDAGLYFLTITVTGGNADVELEFYEQTT